ncbi:MAG TPA: cyclase family protein [Dehalococcoidia bacterium]|nr:cyclase family protein [Dehalococcoidia bacterium]
MTIKNDEELAAVAGTLSNWGRWGKDDELGALNYITPEKRKSAAALVRSGRSVSLARELSLNDGIDRGAHEVFRYPGGGSGDFIGLVFHGYRVTHVDALCHIFGGGRMYNEHSDDAIVESGAGCLSIDKLGPEGIVSRGVLLDVARVKGGPLPLGTAIHPEDLEAAEKAERVHVEEGDILLVRTGRAAAPDGSQASGLHADCLPWLHERKVALLGGDCANDVLPNEFERWRLPIHIVGIINLGLHLLDNADLDPLAKACEAEGRWEFLLTIAPLRIKGGTGSPVNPLALF